MFENELTPQQEQAIALALSGKKDGEIALAIGTSRQTVNTWRNHDSYFQAALEAQRAALRAETADALQALAGKSIRVLSAAMESTNEYVRLKAAWMVLKACEAQTKQTGKRSTDREAMKRELMTEILTESLTEMGRC